MKKKHSGVAGILAMCSEKLKLTIMASAGFFFFSCNRPQMCQKSTITEVEEKMFEW